MGSLCGSRRNRVEAESLQRRSARDLYSYLCGQEKTNRTPSDLLVSIKLNLCLPLVLRSEGFVGLRRSQSVIALALSDSYL